MIKNRAEDPVHEIIYKDIESSNPPKGLLSIIKKAEGFIICPSNPLVSIGPILSVPKIKKTIKSTKKPIIGISPLIGNAPVKGPLDRLMKGLELEVSSRGVATLYRDFVNTFIIDEQDKSQKEQIERLGMEVLVTNTLYFRKFCFLGGQGL